jgi:four helix bundle protein
VDQLEFKRRTKAFGLAAIVLADELPHRRSADVVARQLLRSATSVGANYRAACRARSRSEMFAKLSIVEEEADESLYWLEVLDESSLLASERLAPLHKEGSELLAMVVASKKTLREKMSAEPARAHANRQSAIGNRQSGNRES